MTSEDENFKLDLMDCAKRIESERESFPTYLLATTPQGSRVGPEGIYVDTFVVGRIGPEGAEVVAQVVKSGIAQFKVSKNFLTELEFLSETWKSITKGLPARPHRGGSGSINYYINDLSKLRMEHSSLLGIDISDREKELMSEVLDSLDFVEGCDKNIQLSHDNDYGFFQLNITRKAIMDCPDWIEFLVNQYTEGFLVGGGRIDE
jgi:hypothetical protein